MKLPQQKLCKYWKNADRYYSMHWLISVSQFMKDTHLFVEHKCTWPSQKTFRRHIMKAQFDSFFSLSFDQNSCRITFDTDISTKMRSFGKNFEGENSRETMPLIGEEWWATWLSGPLSDTKSERKSSALASPTRLASNFWTRNFNC